MSNYVFGTGLSYSDYLQARSFERSLKGELSSGTKAIIASNDELHRSHIAVLEEGLNSLSIQFAEMSGSINELNATFLWGLSELLTQTGRINDSLQELIRLASTPAQTWAYEQFEIARDADRKGLFEEAIEYLNRAISGYGGQTGYKLEYRFHFLLGRILVGSFRNHSPRIVNLEDAERAFLLAARYSAQDAPKEAARALLGAGWAAYSRGAMSEAKSHTERAISYDLNLPEAHFQLAKVLMHVNEPAEGLTPLQKAIELDRNYTLKAATDGDFKPHDIAISNLIEHLRLEAKKEVEQCLSTLEDERSALETQRQNEFFLVETLDLESFTESVASVRAAANRETYYGYLDALEACHAAQKALGEVLKEIRAAHIERAQEIESENRSRTQQEATRHIEANKSATTALAISMGSIPCFVLGPVGLILGIVTLRSYSSLANKEGKGYAIAAIVIGGITSAVFMLFLVANMLSNGFQTSPP